jgi:hypothetical protein
MIGDLLLKKSPIPGNEYTFVVFYRVSLVCKKSDLIIRMMCHPDIYPIKSRVDIQDI